MKKIITFLVIILFGIYFLIRDWHVYQEIIDKIIKSDFERSLEYKNIKLSNEPSNPWRYSSRGDTYKKYKKYNEALNDYFKAYELDKKFSYFVFSDISNVYLALGDIEKAYEYINKAIKIEPYPESVLFYLAIIYDYEWKNKEAVETFTKYIKLNDMDKVKSNYLFSLKRRAVHYFLLKEYDKAKDDIGILIKKNPDDKYTKRLKDLLSNIKDMNDSVLHEKFKLDVHEAIVGVTNI